MTTASRNDRLYIRHFDAHVGADGLTFTFYKFGDSQIAFPRGTGEHKKLELLKATGLDTFAAWDGVRGANDTADLHVEHLGDWLACSQRRYAHFDSPASIEAIASGPNAEKLLRIAVGMDQECWPAGSVTNLAASPMALRKGRNEQLSRLPNSRLPATTQILAPVARCPKQASPTGGSP